MIFAQCDENMSVSEWGVGTVNSSHTPGISVVTSQGLVWFGLCCLMTPGLSKDIRCHV